MKLSLTLALLLTSVSAVAFAQTPTAAPAAPAQNAPAMPLMHQMSDRMSGHMDRVWKEMDTNKDNAISKEESMAYGNKKFAERDTNHDGKVTKEEWDAFQTAKMEEMKAKMGAMGNMPMGQTPPTAPVNGAKPAAAPAPTDKK